MKVSEELHAEPVTSFTAYRSPAMEAGTFGLFVSSERGGVAVKLTRPEWEELKAYIDELLDENGLGLQ